MKSSGNKKNGYFGLPLLIIFNVIIVVNLSQLLPVEKIGINYLIFFIIGGILFFIPLTLTVAELSSMNPEKVGMYNWVKTAFNKNTGLIALILQWLAASLFTIVFLTFALVSFAFIITPSVNEALELATNQYYIIPFVLIVYWGMTYLCSKGIKTVKIFSIIGLITTILLPVILLIVLACLYATSDYAVDLNFTSKSIFSSIMNLGNSKIAISTFSFFIGIDLASNLGRHVKNSQKNYFYGTIIAGIIIFILFLILCTFYIIVAKDGTTNLIFTEVNRVLNQLIGTASASRLIGKLFALSLFVGTISYVPIYISVCCRGMLLAIDDLNDELWVGKLNNRNIPARALVMQAVVVSFFCLAFVLQPNSELVFGMLGDFTALLVLIMYIIMFCSFIKIRFKFPDKPQGAYRLPFNKYIVSFIAGVGIISSALAIIMGLYLSLEMTWRRYLFIFIIFTMMFFVFISAFLIIKFSKHLRTLIFEKSDHSLNRSNKIAIALVVLGVLAYFIKYVLNIIFTHNLTPAEYGDLAVFLRTVIIISLVLIVGTNNSTKKYFSKYLVKKDLKNIKGFVIWNRHIVCRVLIIYIISLFALYIIMLILHFFGIKNFFSYHYVYYYLAVAPLAAIAVLLSSYILSNKWPILFFFFRKIAVFIVMLFLVGGGILFYNIKINLYSIGIFLLLSYIIVILAELIFVGRLSKEHNISESISVNNKATVDETSEKKQWLSDSFRMIGSQLIFNLIWAIDLFILEVVHSSEHDVGYYAAMLVLTNILLITPSAITSFLIPRITHFVSEKKFKELQSNINTINIMNFAILTVMLIILLSFSEELLLVFGAGYNSAEIPFLILCFTYYIASIFVPAGKILTFVETDLQFKINLIELIIVIVLGISLTWLWGLTGIAVSVLISIIFKSLLTYIVLKKKIPIKPFSLL
ncbi:MAG: amino acid permease [bacterium]|nr:amino acid permease [bacterium]